MIEIGDDGAAVEAVVPLLQIGGQMLGVDAVEGFVEPGLEVTDLKMNQGQDALGVGWAALGGGLMLDVLAGREVAGPSVGEHVCPWGEAVAEKGANVVGARRGDHGHLGAAHDEAVFLDPRHLVFARGLAFHCHDDQGLVLIGQASTGAAGAAFASVIGFIYLDHAAKEFASVFLQGATELVENGPGNGVAQVEFPGYMHGGDAVLVVGQHVGGSEPFDHGKLGPVQQGSRRHRLLEVAAGAHEDPWLHPELVSFIATVLPAPVSMGPSQPGQVLDAGLLGGEALLEGDERRSFVSLGHHITTERAYAIHLFSI